MEELQLKHLAPYLPYELKFINKDGVILRMDALYSMDYNVWAYTRYIKGERDENDINSKYFSSQNCSGGGYYLKQVKPILRPMSDLSKPCLTDGKTPILELAKIAIKSYEIIFTIKHLNTYSNIAFFVNGEEFGYRGFEFYLSDNHDSPLEVNQLELFQYLFEHHFDVFGLIDKGLAVNINALK